MSLSKLDTMWNIMSKYTFVYSDKCEHDDLRCVICKEVMKDAVLSNICGCHYCYQCIREYTSESEKYCPGDQEYCKDGKVRLGENAVKNYILNKRISKLSVKCSNESCECYVELIEMDHHLRLCTKQPIECPYVAIGCINEKSNKDEILSHLHNDTMSHSELLIELIINLKNEHCVLKEEFAKSKLEIDSLREQLIDKEERIVKLEKENESNERRQNEEIENLRIVVNDLSKDVKDGLEKNKWEISSLKDELSKKENDRRDRESEAVVVVNDLKENFVEINLEMKSLKEELLEKENKIAVLHKELGEVKNEVEIRMTGEREGINKEINEKRRQIEDATIAGENVATKLNDMRKDIDKIMGDFDKMREGENMDDLGKRMNNLIKVYPNIKADFVWRFDEVSKNIRKDMWSESFYPNNYKLCLWMYIYGDGDIGLWCCTMKGDNDERVQWPLRRAVTLSIIDQHTLGTHKSETYKNEFNRPMYDRGDCFGDYHFIKYSSIKDKSSVVVNDSIIVSCVISDL